MKSFKMVSVWWRVLGLFCAFGCGFEVMAEDDGGEMGYREYLISGFEREGKKDYQGAYEAYTKAYELQGNSPTLLIRRAYCGAKVGLTTEVVEMLEKAVLLEPKSNVDFSTMAWFRATVPYSRYQDGVLAVTLAQKSLKLRESLQAYDVLGMSYARMGDFQRARDYLMQGLKKYPEDPGVSGVKERLALYQAKKAFSVEWSDQVAFREKQRGVMRR